MSADVKFGTKFWVKDYGFIFQEPVISPPNAIIKLLAIPGTSMSIDLSEGISGDVEYDRRTIKVIGQAVDGVRRWAHNYSQFMNDVHGRLMPIVFTNDPSFYWMGRVEISKFNCKPTGADIEATIDAEPYKYEITSSLEPWLWDNLSLETIIRDYKTIMVNPTATLVIPGRRKRVCPIFHTNYAMTVTYLGNVYSLPYGTSQVPDIFLGEGNHTLLFTGNPDGLVNVDYRGASL